MSLKARHLIFLSLLFGKAYACESCNLTAYQDEIQKSVAYVSQPAEYRVSPHVLRRNETEACAIIEFSVKDGRAGYFEVKDFHPRAGAARAAIEALKKYKFKPAKERLTLLFYFSRASVMGAKSH
jgi:hypothetical protein